MALVVVVLAVTAGALLQRSTGLGLTLVSGPFLVLVLAPYEGIALANLLSIVTCSIVLATTYRRVDLRRAAQLAVGVAVAVVPGAYVARSMPAPALLVVVGAVTVAVTVVVAAGRPIAVLRRPGGALLSGAVSGFSNVTAGVGGPALAVYGASTGWARAGFVPTVQLVGLLTNVMSLALKRDAHLPGNLVLGCVVAVLLGTAVGGRVDRVLSEERGRALVLGLALAGGLVSMGKGALSW